MKQFFAFVKKEFYHILRDKRTLLVLLIMPVVQIILFGFALSTEIKNLNIAIFDPSKDEATMRISRDFGASRYFQIVENVSSMDEIDRLFLSNSIDLAVIFENNFYERALHQSDASVQIIVDGSNINTATMAVNYASNIISSYQMELAGESFNYPKIVITPLIKMLYNPQSKSAFTFVPGVMGMILMMICAMMTAVAIVREKERGTMEVLLVSPVKPFSIIIAKTIPYLVVSTVNLITILLLSVFVLGVSISGSIVWLFVISIIFIVVSLSLGILISTLVSNQVAAMLASGMLLMLPTILLSGMLFPIEAMPKVLQWITCAFPATWYIDSMKIIMIQGLGVKYALNDMLILIVMAIFYMSLSLIFFKKRLE
jgi:ABC-2 type transport system permease protein